MSFLHDPRVPESVVLAVLYSLLGTDVTMAFDVGLQLTIIFSIGQSVNNYLKHVLLIKIS